MSSVSNRYSHHLVDSAALVAYCTNRSTAKPEAQLGLCLCQAGRTGQGYTPRVYENGRECTSPPSRQHRPAASPWIPPPRPIPRTAPRATNPFHVSCHMGRGTHQCQLANHFDIVDCTDDNVLPVLVQQQIPMVCCVSLFYCCCRDDQLAEPTVLR